jgi:hypothetical protein
MSVPEPAPTTLLLRDVLRFQLKLWLEAARDVVLSPITLAAAVLDFLLLKQQPPRYFRALLMLGRKSEDWIDLWGLVDRGAKGENVDAVLARIEQVVRDPRSGARRARVLLRWAERNVSRQRRAGAVSTMPPPPPPSVE